MILFFCMIFLKNCLCQAQLLFSTSKSTEKMSASEAQKQLPMKIRRVQNPITRTESVPLDQMVTEEERNRRIATPQASSTTTMTTTKQGENQETKTEMTKHPKGHKTRDLDEIWGVLDKQDFLRLTDTLTLNDVWVQPLTVEPDKGAFANVTFKEIVTGTHIKYRKAVHKMAVDDLIKMLYLTDCLYNDMRGFIRLAFDDWLNEKTANCIKNKGIDEGSNRAKLCKYIITEDREFTFYPSILHGSFGIFFRKICCHSYKSKDDNKLTNPSVIKCSSTKSGFEYLIEGRIHAVPDDWFTKAEPLEYSMVDRGQLENLPQTPLI